MQLQFPEDKVIYQSYPFVYTVHKHAMGVVNKVIGLTRKQRSDSLENY